MELWQSLKRWFDREAADAKDVADELEERWSSDLDRREAELAAKPEERVQSLQERIADNTSAFEELRAKITRTGPITDDEGNPYRPG